MDSCRQFKELSCGVILARRASDAVHVGVENLNVVRYVGFVG